MNWKQALRLRARRQDSQLPVEVAPVAEILPLAEDNTSSPYKPKPAYMTKGDIRTCLEGPYICHWIGCDFEHDFRTIVWSHFVAKHEPNLTDAETKVLLRSKSTDYGLLEDTTELTTAHESIVKLKNMASLDAIWQQHNPRWKRERVVKPDGKFFPPEVEALLLAVHERLCEENSRLLAMYGRDKEKDSFDTTGATNATLIANLREEAARDPELRGMMDHEDMIDEILKTLGPMARAKGLLD